MILDPNLYVEVLIYSYIYQGFQSCDISEIFCYYIMCCGGGGGFKGARKKGEWVQRGQESGWVGGRNSRWKARASQVDRLVGVVGRMEVV